jgi:polar amino acid transport system substrate-binding protein
VLAASAAAPSTLTFCSEDQDNYPWVLQRRPSYISVMLDMVQPRLGMSIQLVAKPWKRCLTELQLNLVDGVVNASFLQERQAIGVYPEREGQLDTNRRMLMNRYTLYQVRGNGVQWDGKTLTGLTGPVGVQTSFSIADQLREMNVKVDESSKSAGDVLRNLVIGNIAAAALQPDNADRLIADNPTFRTQIVKLPAPFVEKPYYLMLSRRLVSTQPQLAERVWDEVAKVREMPEFKRRVAQILGGN